MGWVFLSIFPLYQPVEIQPTGEAAAMAGRGGRWAPILEEKEGREVGRRRWRARGGAGQRGGGGPFGWAAAGRGRAASLVSSGAGVRGGSDGQGRKAAGGAGELARKKAPGSGG